MAFTPTVVSYSSKGKSNNTTVHPREHASYHNHDTSCNRSDRPRGLWRYLQQLVWDQRSTSGDITDNSTTYTVHTAGEQYQLETVVRPAGVVEQIDINRTITTNAVTTSLSVFSQ